MSLRCKACDRPAVFEDPITGDMWCRSCISAINVELKPDRDLADKLDLFEQSLALGISPGPEEQENDTEEDTE